MRIRLIAIDLDGTLLNSDKRISQPTARALARARAEGIRVVLASARPPRTVLPFYRQLGLSAPMVNYNGALVRHPPTGRVLLHRPIATKTARRAVTLAREIYPRVLVSAEIMDRWYTDRFDGSYLTETARICRPDVVAPVGAWLTRAVTKLLLLGRQNRLARIAAAIGDELADELTIVQTENDLLQITHAMVSKARALMTAAAELGVARENVMAIGDNANDIGMLRWAAVGVAMANGHPQALAAADYVTEGHDSDGVAAAVTRILAGKPPGEVA